MNTEEFENTNKNLKRAENIRQRNLQVCATCKHWRNTGGFGYCVRPGGFGCDVGDMTQYFTVCDGWTKGQD